ncbi:MAG: Fe-S cluster assembly protein SufD [Actinobacteria bacterium]|nr:Fe-S cluster assembly protein SufD [Actinomycetota bacterium]
MPDTLTNHLTQDAIPDVGEPAWAREQRARAFEQLEALPMPSQETEEWRYTDVSSLDLGSFAPFAEGSKAENLDGVPTALLAAAGRIGERAGLLIQHNSVTTTSHLDPAVDAGVHFESLDDALRDHPELVEPYLNTLVPTERSRFTAMHGAFRTGGTFVRVPRGVTVELPLQSLTYVDADGTAVFPHTVLVVEEDAEVTFIDRYVSPPLTRALSAAVAEIHVARGARVRYMSLQDWGTGMTHLGIQRARVGQEASLHTLAVAFGADLARAEAESVLAEPGAYSEMLGLYFATGEQHYDHRSLQDHVAPSCSSQLLYKGALKGSSRAIYSGWVTVRPDAQRTDAFQTNRNIVLSDRAKADSIPNLEIEANDVKCGHAASTGPVDEDTLFYLQTRGLTRDAAEHLIVTGFFQEVIDRVGLPEVAAGLTEAIELELARGT